MSVFEVLSRLEATSSRNEKIAILQSQSDNELLVRVLAEALDPFRNFFIRQVPEYTASGVQSLEWALDQLDLFATRVVTGNAAIYQLTNILAALDEQSADVFERIIKKDLRCGVSDSTVNKVWPSLIPTYPCMLCSPFEQRLVDKIQFPAYVQLKMDGMRFNAIVRQGKVEFRSRNGKQLDLLGHLEQEFIKLAAGGQDMVFDGELLVMIDGKIAPRQIGNGILSKANKGTISEQEAALVHATLWDIIPYSGFAAGKAPIPYKNRFAQLSSLDRPERIHLVEYTVVDSLDAAKALFDQYLDQGQEGIILKDCNGHWEDKRAKHQIKFKGENECDLRIVGWEAGTGKNAGRLGALVLESEDGVVKTNVGTGFTDKDRDTITDKVVGMVCAVKYNTRIVDKKTGIHSLFLPVYIEIRWDKETADLSDQIK